MWAFFGIPRRITNQLDLPSARWREGLQSTSLIRQLREYMGQPTSKLWMLSNLNVNRWGLEWALKARPTIFMLFAADYKSWEPGTWYFIWYFSSITATFYITWKSLSRWTVCLRTSTCDKRFISIKSFQIRTFPVPTKVMLGLGIFKENMDNPDEIRMFRHWGFFLF